MLTSDQKARALEAAKAWLEAKPGPTGKTPKQIQAEDDCSRKAVIKADLAPLLADFFAGKLTLENFKTRIDSVNKRKAYWGFSGINGQMFFNMLAKAAADHPSEREAELKVALEVPSDEEIAKSRIRTFTAFVRRVGEQWIASGGSPAGKPRLGSAAFFLSYFWQIQKPDVWPVYYKNSVTVMGTLNLWEEPDDLADAYIIFKQIHEELGDLLTTRLGTPFTLYDVEHVFWFKGGNPFGGNRPLSNETPVVASALDQKRADESEALPDSYVPPVVAVLPAMARNEASLQNAAKRSGTSLERAFERAIHSALLILGYEATLLGQGAGRVPDGKAISHDDRYALIWDAKIRQEGYTIGTDDRVMRDYIATQTRELKKNGSLKNVYYVVVSSGFSASMDDDIHSLKMETGINEVCLIEAEALVALVELKLRDPRELSLGSDGLQQIFSTSGIISLARIDEIFGA